jgi:plastocyanin
MRRRCVLVLVVLASVAGLAGCGSSNKVGDKSLLDFKEQTQTRLGETTTTIASAATTTTAAGPGATRPGTAATTPRATATTATTKPAAKAATTTTTAAPAQVTLEITINGDGSSDPLDPQYARAFVGSIIRWVNKDTKPRSVVAVSGQFRSPEIPAGGHYDYKATTAGIFDYGDGTRPYVNATLEVLEH